MINTFTLNKEERAEAYSGAKTIVEVFDKDYTHKRLLFSKVVYYNGKTFDMFMDWLQNKYPNGDIVIH